MEQINMFDIVSISTEEKNKLFFDNVVDILTSAERDDLKLSFKSVSAYDLISIGNQPADIRVKFGKKKSYFSVPRHYKKFLSEQDYYLDNSKRWIIIDIETPSDAYKYKNLFYEVYDKRYSQSLPDSFDCCSKYMECSEAEKCIHTIPDVKKYCKYKAKLAKGIIFYGSKRNVF